MRNGIKVPGFLTLAFMLCLAGLVMTAEADVERFVDNGDGTITDTRTNLMWTKDANPFGLMNWEEATAGCRSFSVSGIGGWRMPTINELTFMSYSIQLMRDGHPFTGIQPSDYWSGTAYEGRPDAVQIVNMGFASTSYADKSGTGYAWPVQSAR